MRTLLTFPLLFLIICSFLDTVISEPLDRENYRVEIYDHRTGKCLGAEAAETYGSGAYPQIERDNLPMEEWSPDFAFSWGTGAIGFITDSVVGRIEIDFEERKIYVWIEGENANGRITLFLPELMIPYPDNVRVYLDNEPLHPIVVRLAWARHVPDWFDYLVHVDFRHHRSLLLFDFGPAEKQSRSQLLELAVIPLGILAILGVYRLRRK
jgi:hypothetical protein